MDYLAAITEERLRIADWLETLEPEQWATPSCCDGWTLLETTAHLLVGPVNGLRKSVGPMIKARGNFAVANDIGARGLAANGPEWVVAKLREISGSNFRPPGFSFKAPLTDVLIHGRDLSLPLGVDLDVPVDRWQVPLETATARSFTPFSSRSTLKDLRFEASDIDFSHGDGPAVSGTARDLAHAMWGRAESLDLLTGDGVATLRSRLT